MHCQTSTQTNHKSIRRASSHDKTCNQFETLPDIHIIPIRNEQCAVRQQNHGNNFLWVNEERVSIKSYDLKRWIGSHVKKKYHFKYTQFLPGFQYSFCVCHSMFQGWTIWANTSAGFCLTTISRMSTPDNPEKIHDARLFSYKSVILLNSLKNYFILRNNKGSNLELNVLSQRKKKSNIYLGLMLPWA